MSHSEEDKELPKSRKQKVTALLEGLQKRLDSDESKASVADYIRLMQFEKELEEEQLPRELNVRWSELSETYDIDE